MTKLRLFDVDIVHNTLIEKVKTFIDPLDSTPLYGDHVVKIMPAKISLYGGLKAHIVFRDIPTTHPKEVGGEKTAIIKGGLYLWVQGQNEDSVEKCERCLDISRAYFDNKDLLGLKRCTISTPNDNVMQLADVTVADQGQRPQLYTLGFTGFVIEKELGSTTYTI